MMKLRLTKGEIRIRLGSAELNDFAVLGRLEETVELGVAAGGDFRFVLEKADVPEPSAGLENNELTVRIPADSAKRWTSSDLIGIEAGQSTDGETLRILIEKDLGRRSSRTHRQ